MVNINKKEFFKEFNSGDIYGLENLKMQLTKLEKDYWKKNTENTKEIEEIIRAKSILNFTISLNYLYIETQTAEYAEKYYSKIEDLYSNDLLSDLFNILEITNKDFEKYAN